MRRPEWMQDVTIDMLPPQHQWLAEVIGVDAALTLCETYGGDEPYIPQYNTAYAWIRAQRIRKEHAEGCDVRALARKYQLREVEVRYILGGWGHVPPRTPRKKPKRKRRNKNTTFSGCNKRKWQPYGETKQVSMFDPNIR